MMHHIRVTYALLALGSSIVGCERWNSLGESETEGGSPPLTCEGEIAAEDYDRSCSVDADCVAVFEGRRTAPCRTCGFAAINVAGFAAYNEALGPLSCADLSECAADCSHVHGDDRVSCVNNECTLEPGGDTNFESGGDTNSESGDDTNSTSGDDTNSESGSDADCPTGCDGLDDQSGDWFGSARNVACGLCCDQVSLSALPPGWEEVQTCD